MNKEEKLVDIIAGIIECEPSEISMSTALDKTIWDSLAVVSFMAEVDSNFDKILSPIEVAEATSIKDLFKLL